MRVLVVDDSLTIRTIIKKVLKGLGYEDVAEAADGVLAIAAYQECRPDLMLVDWNMPNMDGLTLVKKIREVDKCVKILMVTTEAEKNRVVTAIQAGVNNYVIKPFTPDALKDKIDQTLAKQAQMTA